MLLSLHNVNQPPSVSHYLYRLRFFFLRLRILGYLTTVCGNCASPPSTANTSVGAPFLIDSALAVFILSYLHHGDIIFWYIILTNLIEYGILILPAGLTRPVRSATFKRVLPICRNSFHDPIFML